MITGFFLSVFFVIVTWIVGFLPTYAFPSQIGDGIEMFWGYVNLFSMVVPVGTILTVLGVAFFYMGVILLWQLGHYMLRRIRR